MTGGGADGCTLYDCLLSGNRAVLEWDEPSGGGAKNSTLVNCTVAGNTAFRGGGVQGGTMINCIVYGNAATNSPNWHDGAFTNSCTTPLPAGANNVTNDPQFVNSGNGDYRLGFASPCIDAGDNAAVSGTEDLAGQPRIANGVVDMGAYELQSLGMAYADWALAITNGLTNATDCAAGDGVPNLFRYAAGCPDPMVPDDFSRLILGANGLPSLIFNRNPDAADLFWIVQGADAISNGAAWRGVATNVGGSWLGAANVSESGSGNPVVCTVTDPVALESNRFLRLNVTRP